MKKRNMETVRCMVSIKAKYFLFLMIPYSAFSVVSQMNPRPDNVYLLVDGLPTHGASPPSGLMVSGKQRLKNFSRAIRNLPRGVPMNVILFAMEGDAYAPDSFWKLARNTKGSFMSPSLDWP